MECVMERRKEQFKIFTNFNFTELDEMIFKPGRRPPNEIDYYYHTATKTTYTYFWSDESGYWRNDISVDPNNIASPHMINPNLVEFTSKKKSHKDDGECHCIIS